MSFAPTSFEDWYQTTFTSDHSFGPRIPPAASVEAPDSTAPLDIEIYNFSPYPEVVSTTDIQHFSPDLDGIRSTIATDVAKIYEISESEYVYDDKSTFWSDLNRGLAETITQDQGEYFFIELLFLAINMSKQNLYPSMS